MTDPLTIAAAAVVTYLAATIFHEVIGHGVVCMLLGGRVLSISSVFCEWDYRSLSRNRERAVEAGGSLANLAAGLACACAVPFVPLTVPAWRYLLWLSAEVNLLQAGGYLMFSPLLGFGDWASFVRGLKSPMAWKVGLTAAGLFLSIGALNSGIAQIDVFCGGERSLRTHQAWMLTALPYGCGALVSCVAALWDPSRRRLIFSSAAASTLGGTSWLLWIGGVAANTPPRVPHAALLIPENSILILSGAIALLFWLLPLGRGLKLRNQAP
jgi:hypothetical protein